MPPSMHLFHPGSTLDFAVDYWRQPVASSCFAVEGLASIDFEPRIAATVASAYAAAFANAAVRSALAAFAIA